MDQITGVTVGVTVPCAVQTGDAGEGGGEGFVCVWPSSGGEGGT